MRTVRRYQVVLGVVILMFVYGIVTEVAPRIAQTHEEYRALRQKQRELLDPSSVSTQMRELTRRRSSLDSLLTDYKGRFDQNTTGVVQLLTQTARPARLHIKSLRPLDVEREGQFENIGFSLSLTSGFHELGVYVNSLEMSGMSIDIRKIELSVRSIHASLVEADIEGVAHVVPNVRLE